MAVEFAKTNAGGSPKTCKFCHVAVWWHYNERRWYDVGGKTLHVENCPRRAKHYREVAAEAADLRRRNKRTAPAASAT